MFQMMEELKSFICHESQESINIYNFNPSNPTQRFKAQRNGIPAVLQFSSLSPHLHSQFAGTYLCPGILESDLVNQEFKNKIEFCNCVRKMMLP